MSDKPYEIFTRALRISEPKRVRFVAEACGGDKHLEVSVNELLQAHTNGEPTLETQPGSDSDHEDYRELVGLEVGGCRLDEVVGSGASGVVFRARQQHPDRDVAVKLMRPGLISKSRLARFEFEAEALARLDHDGIARVHSSGTMPTGVGLQPFIVMEHISGVAIDEYADAHDLDHNARLELIAKLCDAVEHAHHNGVIHRDLKPANVLVQGNNGESQPKVIDFGIAIAADDSGSLTRTGGHEPIGTIQYMSPEQAGGERPHADGRSDVYAIGVMAHAMLSGSLPYDLSGTPIADAIRTVQETEPRSLGSYAKHLRGDVETIIAKALEKDPTRRYQSPGDLADDIRRHLRSEPITARPPTLPYVLGRSVKRHKLLYALGSCIVLLLVTAVIGTGIGLHRAGVHLAETKIAQREAEAITEFLLRLMRSPDPEQLGRDARVIDMLAVAGERLDSLSDLPVVKARLQDAIGRSYLALGDPSESLAHLEGAIQSYTTAPGDQRERIGNSMLQLGRAHTELGRHTEALSLMEETVAYFIDTLGPDHPTTLTARHYHGVALLRSPRKADAVRVLESVLADRRRVLGDGHTSTLDTASVLGGLYTRLGETEKAERLLAGTAEAYTAAKGPEHPGTIGIKVNLGLLWLGQSRYEEAADLNEELLPISRRVMGESHSTTLQIMLNLGSSYAEQERYDEAIDVWTETLRLRIAVSGESHPATFRLRTNIAMAEFKRGNLDEAGSELRSIITEAEAAQGPGHIVVLQALSNLGNVLVEDERDEEAARYYGIAAERGARVIGPANPKITGTFEKQADALERVGRHEDALEVWKRLVLTVRTDPSKPEYLERYTERLRACLIELGREEEADDIEAFLSR